MGEHTRLIFSTAADAVLADKLCALGVGVPGDIERETFPDGERGLRLASRVVFFFNDTATTKIYTLSLLDALPIVDDLQRRPWGATDGQVIDRYGLDWLIGFQGHET